MHLPIINEISSLKSLVNTLIQNNPQIDNYVATMNNEPHNHFALLLNKIENCLWVGPEGGFSNQEIAFMKENKFKTCSLGFNTLRTETAGFFGLSMMHLHRLKNSINN